MKPSRFAGTFLVLLFCRPLLAQPARPTGDLRAEVDKIFASWSTPQSPGCAVGISNGQIVLRRAYGAAELEHGIPNTPETVFEAGSVSKQFVAAAILLLAQRGKISLDDPVRRHVPELPDYGAPLTIRHLLHHTSGLREWGSISEIAGWPRGSRVHTHAHVLDVMSRQRALNHPPGAEFSYVNVGYNLLAIIIERVSRQSLNAFSKEHLFQPLGMSRTEWRDDYTRIVRGRATAYERHKDGYHAEMPFEDIYGNGGLLTTVGDLLLWSEMFFRPRPEHRALVAAMEQRGKLGNGMTIHYAAGLKLAPYQGTLEVYHDGATAAYRSFLTRFPARGLAIAILCNAAEADGRLLAARIRDLFLGAPLLAAAVPVPLERLSLLSGLYRNRVTDEPMRLLLEGRTLRIEGEGELAALSATHFRLGRGPRLLRFDLDGAGRPLEAHMLYATGQDFTFLPAPPIAPDAAALAAYVGEFRSEEAEATLWVERGPDGALRLRRRPLTLQALKPYYRDAFIAEDLGQIAFVRDGEGKVNGLRISTSRVRSLPFARVR